MPDTIDTIDRIKQKRGVAAKRPMPGQWRRNLGGVAGRIGYYAADGTPVAIANWMAFTARARLARRRARRTHAPPAPWALPGAAGVWAYVRAYWAAEVAAGSDAVDRLRTICADRGYDAAATLRELGA